MTDNYNDNDVAYQFQDPSEMNFDVSPLEEQTKPLKEVPKKEKGKKKSKKRLILLIILVLIIAGVYSVWPMIKSNINSDKVSAQPVFHHTKVTQPLKLVQPKPVIKKISSVAIMPPKHVINEAKVNKLIGDYSKSDQTLIKAVQQQQVANKEKLSVVTNELSALTAVINKLQKKLNQSAELSALNKRIGKLQSTVAILSKNYDETKKLQRQVTYYRHKLYAKKAKHLRHLKQYYVQAVIPGRAWLQGLDGKQLSVSVGNKLPGYGEIKKIDAYSGTVFTSSGVKLHYAINE